MNLLAVAYSSQAIGHLGFEDLHTLLINARRYNEQHGISGALLFDNGAFVQYFEGSPVDSDKVYARIKKSSLHGSIVELMREPIDARHFERWHMAFAQPAKTTLQEIANEDWAKTLPGLHEKGERSRGLALLLSFWDSAVDVDYGTASRAP